MNDIPQHILIIDDSKEFRTLLCHFLVKIWPEVQVTEYDPVAKGKPGDDFDWTPYSVVLLDYQLGHGENGLVWLRRFQRAPHFPPVIFMSAHGNEDIAVKALKLGAEDYLRKDGLTLARFTHAIKDAVKVYHQRLEAQEAAEERTQTMDMGGSENDLVMDDRTTPTNDIKRTQLPGYKILKQIGDGGMSTVFLAERQKDYTQVVLKFLDKKLSQDREFFQLFMREYQIISTLENPFVVKIHDMGLTADHAYIAMEHFSKGDLKGYLRQPISPRRALEIVKQTAIALDGIHAVGIVHRDIKPANIMFRRDDTLGVVDFGIATQMTESDAKHAGGKVLGTPAYMSPEQGQGQTLDGRSDLYSLGIIFFEMLVGQRPYRANSAPGLVAQHIHEKIPRMPEELAEYQPFIDNLLAKKATARYANGQALVEALLQKWPTL